MIQVQVTIELIPDGDSCINIYQLAREDVTADERAYAQAIEELLKSIMTRVHADAGDELAWTEIQPREDQPDA